MTGGREVRCPPGGGERDLPALGSETAGGAALELEMSTGTFEYDSDQDADTAAEYGEERASLIMGGFGNGGVGGGRGLAKQRRGRNGHNANGAYDNAAAANSNGGGALSLTPKAKTALLVLAGLAAITFLFMDNASVALNPTRAASGQIDESAG